MLTDIFLIIVGGFLAVVSFALSQIGFLIPQQISDSFGILFNYLNYFQGIFPITETLQVLAFLLTFSAVWYSAKLVMRAYSLLPFIGRKSSLNSPTHKV